jgi:hypothetical protein
MISVESPASQRHVIRSLRLSLNKLCVHADNHLGHPFSEQVLDTKNIIETIELKR